MSSNSDHSPLNINLLIPFKDNIGERQKLYSIEIERFRKSLEDEVESIKSELDDLFGKEFEISIVGRSDGNSKRYYWRFKSSKKDRKFNRLNSASLSDYLTKFSDDQKKQLKDIERSIIYINANLKLVKGMIDSLAQCNDEIQSVHEAIF